MMEEIEKIAAAARQRQIDKDVARYVEASERADFATMAEVCAFAEGDSELSNALWKAALELAAEEQMSEEKARKIRGRIRKILRLEP